MENKRSEKTYKRGDLNLLLTVKLSLKSQRGVLDHAWIRVGKYECT